MLQSNPSPKGTGIEIWGDYGDLAGLHQTIHKIGNRLNEYDNKFKGQSDIIMSLAYEVRKSFEGSRLREQFSFDSDNRVEYFGFQYLWTDLLFAVSVLRLNAGYVTMDELDQANLYILEYNLKSSLTAYDPKGAETLKLFIGQRINVHDPLIFLILQGINFEYLSQKPSKTRFRNIPNLIVEYTSFFSETHKLWRKDLEKSAKQLGCDVLDIEYGEYPDFEF
ncbi:hypothetical protein GN157_12845 [Flavobacterium rakeshii]|uniref:Uncharacterized protein n=1 Tax=Flavobacterium rakeshii TaxID=1038845 RepID=A0A6N8HFT9_9FLAO|nr:hypothetical protein [Flavobacterium rakeshii]MUV04597.1 hypothetical protein [Flavobacterium rakeshii]